MYTTCSELEVFMYWTGKSMNNLLSYGGLVDARITASGKDLLVWLNIFLSWFVTFKEYSKMFSTHFLKAS